MNKILLPLNVLLIGVVGFLFYKVYREEPKDQVAVPVQQKAANMPVTSKIAFVMSDSITERYLFIKEKTQELKNEEKRMQSQMDAQMRNAQETYASLQQKAATMTDKELQAAEMQVQQLQQKMQELRYRQQEEFQNKTIALQKDLFNRVKTYLSKYNETQKFDYILSYEQGGTVLFAKDTLDITNDVITGLNAEYEASKKVKK